MNDDFVPWPEGYHRIDVATVDGVSLVDAGRAVMLVTGTEGLKVCVVIPLGDLVGAVRQLVAHVAPAEVHRKNLIVVNGGRPQ